MTYQAVDATVQEHDVVRRPCTLLRECVIGLGTWKDYQGLEAYHYRGGQPRATRAIYRAVHNGETVGVIVYAAASLNLAIRNQVLNNRYRPASTFGKAMVAQAINREVDLISRVIVHPTFRGIGLGVRLIKETLELRPFKYVEMSAAMGAINPFAEKAGMTPYPTGSNDATVRALAALRGCGIHPDEVANPSALLRKIESLQPRQQDHLFKHLTQYQKTWQQGRAKRPFHPDIKVAVSILSANALLSPVYYLWVNQS